MSIKATILSLPKDAARRNACGSELAQLGLSFEFIDGIAGSQLAEEVFDGIYDAELNRSVFKRPLNRNEVACALGHRKIWRKIADGEQPIGFVLEDDATFLHDPRPFLTALMQNAEQFEGVMIKMEGVSRSAGRVVGTVADQSLILSDRLPPRTTGYIIGRQAAKNLLSFTETIARPIDINLKFYWEHRVPILTLTKQLVNEREFTKSNIESPRRDIKPGSPLSRFARNLIYQANFTYGRLTHPLNPDSMDDLAPLRHVEGQIRASV
ncbi:glycosyltransferase family 25 protein [Ruegeria sp.]|uniref:glycosyltransferase family 25 protein n=1 Tax=Ruegeria sp. TaxID=1879320 RepID=UPI003C79ADEA